ncbi:hypothetical protein [Faecalimicrobium dakarense]|uniref:hypothetical protein n=1 Tax=Faecalimicrobium dakarense TaxID=1301100 RepID=UPI0004BCB180|nr:hypothetical protein [[Clostridium] dakarense]
MKKRRILITVMLLLSIMINVPTSFAQQSNYAIPPMLQNIKGKNELVSIFNEIKAVRENISTIDINALTIKDKSNDLKKQINFYITQLTDIETKISSFNRKYSDSEPDLLFSQQLSIIAETYKMTLAQQLALIDSLLRNDPEASTLFHSNYLTYIYYYLSLGDQMLAYIDVYYDLL